MSELSIMDYFLTKTKDKVDLRMDTDMEISPNYDNPELMVRFSSKIKG